MSIETYLPFWQKLTPAQRETISRTATTHQVQRGTVIHNGSEDCVGLLLIVSGQLRAFILSDEGKEITHYRLLSRDICLFSASCMLNSIQFDISIEAEQDTTFYKIPTKVYHHLMQESAPVANYTNELISARFSDVMWLMDQILYKRLDSRLAAFLLEESALTDTTELKITHDAIARHLGSAREVVTRMLKYLQSEGAVTLSRGSIAIADEKKLRGLAQESLR